jgi:DNA invertase Pin-like site-specific DNA recombinase
MNWVLGLIYIRQSRHKKYERTVSPEVQEQECRELPEIRACSDVIVYRDLDLSGASVKRRKDWLALRARLESIRKDERVVLALYDQSRSFRNTAEALELYALLEAMPWIDVVFVHGTFDRSPIGEFSYTTLAAAHALERRMAAIKIREAKRFATAHGESVGPLPTGYKWAGEGVNRWVEIDETTAPIVRRAFADYATGNYSSRELAARLNAEGMVVSARCGPTARRGQGWYGDTLMYMLANVAYIGKTYSVSRQRREGELIDAKWPAVIDIATWEAVQRQRLRNYRRGGDVVAARPPRAYAFQRILRCSCGRRLYVQSGKGGTYYRCRGAEYPDRCQASMVPEKALLPWARQLIEVVDRLAPAAFQAATEALANEDPTSPDALSSVEESLRRADFMFYSAKRWDEDHYLAEVTRLTALRDELAAQATPQKPPLDFTGVLSAWDSGDPGTRRDLLASLFDALNVEDGAIVACLPRADRAADVVTLLRYVTNVAGAEGEGFEPPGAWRPLRFSRPAGRCQKMPCRVAVNSVATAIVPPGTAARWLVASPTGV